RAEAGIRDATVTGVQTCALPILLDWTRSPYVAAFFALRYVPPAAKHAAVYGYCADLGRGKAYSVTDGQIISRGPYVSTHRRHFLDRKSVVEGTMARLGGCGDSDR